MHMPEGSGNGTAAQIKNAAAADEAGSRASPRRRLRREALILEQTYMSGRQTVLMDQRGRISFPAAFRSSVGDTLYTSPDSGNRGFLVVRSEAGYRTELERIKQEFIDRGYDDEDVKDELRDYGKDTERIPPDKNGRITIPERLVAYAGLSGKVVVVGVGEYAELWSEERLLAYEKEREELKARRRAKKDRERKARLEALAAEDGV